MVDFEGGLATFQIERSVIIRPQTSQLGETSSIYNYGSESIINKSG